LNTGRYDNHDRRGSDTSRALGTGHGGISSILTVDPIGSVDPINSILTIFGLLGGV
jgi:hypothetical protein